MANTIEHSIKFEMVQTFYMRGAWNDEKIRNAVVKGWITEEEYDIIVGN